MEQTLKIKKLDKDVVLPEYAHEKDACMDVFSNEEVLIKAGEWALVHTGLCVEIPSGFEMQIRSKSGLALKNGIIVLNSPATIEENYRGELGVEILNVSKEDYLVLKYQKIAQICLSPVINIKIKEIEEMSKSDRGEGGFGSSGLSSKNSNK